MTPDESCYRQFITLIGKWNFRRSRNCLNQTIIIDTAEMSGILKQTMRNFESSQNMEKGIIVHIYRFDLNFEAILVYRTFAQNWRNWRYPWIHGGVPLFYRKLSKNWRKYQSRTRQHQSLYGIPYCYIRKSNNSGNIDFELENRNATHKWRHYRFGNILLLWII